jgi:hemolysin III
MGGLRSALYRSSVGATVPVQLGRPLLRGWFHLVAFFLSLPAGALLLGVSPTTTARLAAAVYAAAVATLFGVSASYHRGQWSATARLRMQRLDHATIFVMIAGSYTPFCLLVLDGGVAAILLVAVWAGAAIGVVMATTGLAEKRILGLASYLALGWTALAALPQLVDQLGGSGFVLLVAGGAAYTLGAIGFGLRWPDPFPRVFGYHEVWHAMVLAAAVCHYIVILSVVHAAEPS